MTIRQAITDAATSISTRDAEALLRALLRRDRAWMIAHAQDILSEPDKSAFESQIFRRASGEPLQYITGEQEFFGLTMKVSPAVLIPRPETEHLVEAVLAWQAGRPRPRIVDVGTGSGAIAISLAKQIPDSEVFAIDISADALVVAKNNAVAHDVQEKIQFVHGDLLGGIDINGVDIVVSNPPYIPVSDAADMQREVVEHEPHTALFADESGLVVYQRLIPQASRVLRPGGLLAMEFGFAQRDALKMLLTDWQNVTFIDDYAGISRVVTATRN